MIDRYTYPEMKRLWSEEHKLELWLRVEILACEGWAALGAIGEEDLAAIRRASLDRARMEEIYRESHHDVLSFVRAVAESVGPAGRFIHLGLTSSDVLDTALAVVLCEACDLLAEDLQRLEAVLTRQALAHKYTLMVGRTHGIHAEPLTLGHKLAVWVAEVRRHRTRLAQAREMVAVGKLGGAVGTHANVPPEVEEYVCRQLGLRPAEAATQIVQRDRHAQFVLTLALIASSLEKFATEIRGLQRTEVGEVAEPFAPGQQGSSAMPHKRNPELAERVCGLARVVRSAALPALENVVLWHERDISHSSVERIILPDACLALDYMLRTFTHIMEGLDVYPERMRRNLERSGGLVYSGRVLLALVEKGMSRQAAYELVQRYAKQVWQDEAGDFRALLAADPQVRALLGEEELARLFDPSYHLRAIDTAFERLGLTAAAAAAS
ncbi:MAG TPA: adenylosuccinate lyase [Chloroflexota bacterium]|jgi:adenylosuccinate lyase|nr:adenylosuccinate lyase [Chloroflexota bacterium]